MALAIDSGEKFQLPTLVFFKRTFPEREANGDQPRSCGPLFSFALGGVR